MCFCEEQNFKRKGAAGMVYTIDYLIDKIISSDKPYDIEKIKAGQRAHDCFAKRSKNMAWRKAISEGRKGKYTGLDNPFGGKHHTPETKARISEANSKAVLMCDMDGKVIKRFNSLVEARDYLIGEGITTNKSCQTPISKCCRGVEQRKSCYGFVWKYEKV